MKQLVLGVIALILSSAALAAAGGPVLVVTPPASWPVQTGVQGDGYPGSNLYCTAVLSAPYVALRAPGNGSGQCRFGPLTHGGQYAVTMELTTTIGGSTSTTPPATGVCAVQTGANLGSAPQYCALTAP